MDPEVQKDVKDFYIGTKRLTSAALYTAMIAGGVFFAPVTGGLSLVAATAGLTTLFTSTMGRYSDVMVAMSGDVNYSDVSNPEDRGSALEATLIAQKFEQRKNPVLDAITAGAWNSFKQVPTKIISHSCIAGAALWDVSDLMRKTYSQAFKKQKLTTYADTQNKGAFVRTERMHFALMKAGLITPTRKDRLRIIKNGSPN